MVHYCSKTLARPIVLWLFCLALPWHAILAQDSLSYRAYYMDGGDVVFEFNRRYFSEATRHGSHAQTEFEGLDIESVALSGSFNDWSVDGWKMEEVGPGLYQLRKSVQDFNDHFTWAFKFVINGTYWAEPDPSYISKADIIQSGPFWRSIYNHKLQLLRPEQGGNACFELKGHPKADQVILTGTFIDWSEDGLPMQQTGQGWELCLELPAGTYEYKFIADGEWLHDPANEETRPNEYQTLNSVRHIAKPYSFFLPGYENASSVRLAGSFTQWETGAIFMQAVPGGWKATVDLSGGKHTYKFIVDGEWVNDPSNPFREYDRDGNLNSVLRNE